MLDLVFKIYVSKNGSRGLMIAGIAVIWGALQFTFMMKNGIVFSSDHATLFFGGLAALALTVSNIALLECLSKLPISVASTIYRLNTIPLVLMAVVFLGEGLDVYRILGVLVGLLTVVLLHSRISETSRHPAYDLFWFGLILFACVVRASYGILTKAGLNAGAGADSMMVLAALGWFIGGLLYFTMIESRRKIRLGPIYLIVIAGILVFSVVWLLTNALLRGDASVVVPITNMGFVAAFVFSLAWRLEQLTFRKTMAIGSAIVSIGFLTFGMNS
ncbi:MAG: drug/metabolite transporter (DMT)-like permease [Halioglobus sp.]|jgi:drug/metabolite transporter (DMT)-like permease